MSQYLLIFIFGLGFGILIPYIFQLLDLFMNFLASIQALHASKIQKEINNLSDVEAPELQSCIGFRYEKQEEENYDEEIEEDKIKNN